MPGNGRYRTFNLLGVPYIDMVNINRSSTSVPYMTNYDLHTLIIIILLGSPLCPHSMLINGWWYYILEQQLQGH